MPGPETALQHAGRVYTVCVQVRESSCNVLICLRPSTCNVSTRFQRAPMMRLTVLPSRLSTSALQDAVLQLLQDTRIPAMLAAAAAAGISSDASSPRAPSAPGLPPPSDGDAAAVDGSTTTAAAASVTHVSDPEALWRDLMDASAAYDVALLPLLGATGPEVEAAAAKASSLLAAAARSTGIVTLHSLV